MNTPTKPVLLAEGATITSVSCDDAVSTLPLRILLADGHVGKSPAPASAFSAALITDFTPEQT